jgi:hypothetical protein
MGSPHTAVCSWIFLHVFVLPRLPALGEEFNRLELEGTQEVYLYLYLYLSKFILNPPMVPSCSSKRAGGGCKRLLFTTSSDLSAFQHYLFHLSSTLVQFFHFFSEGSVSQFPSFLHLSYYATSLSLFPFFLGHSLHYTTFYF